MIGFLVTLIRPLIHLLLQNITADGIPAAQRGLPNLMSPLLEQFISLLENVSNILEQPDALLADFDQLFEQMANILEDRHFIRTF